MDKYFYLLLISLLMLVYACEKEVEASLIVDQLDINIANVGETKSITFESNMSWSVTSSELWCLVSPSSGNKSQNNTTITVSANDTYENRSCIITITAGSVSKAIRVNQYAKQGLIITQDRYDLSSNECTIEVEVQTNIEFDVKISNSWITNVTTKGLNSSKLTFNIAKNELYENREGFITISQKDGILSNTIYIYQSKENAIILKANRLDLSSDNHSLEIELKTNVDFEIDIPQAAQNWISYIGTKTLRTETLLLNVSENFGNKARSVEVIIKDKSTSVVDTLIITQHKNEPLVYYVSKMGALSSNLSKKQKDTITKMKVKGELNKSDFDVFKNSMPNLKYLDLKDVKCENNEIPNDAFGSYNTSFPKLNISTIIFPESITSIGNYAFFWCSNLTGSLILPDNLTNIGMYAFGNCYNLSGSLNLPNKLLKIGEYAFYNCNGFNGSLNLNCSLESIGEYAFAYCHGFKGSLILPNRLKIIERCTFIGCYGFDGYLSFPSELREIGWSAFSRCSGLNGSLNFPETVKKIDEFAFSACYGLNGSLHFSEELTIIGKYAFYECSKLTGSLIFPDGITKIGESAFANCIGLNGSLRLPKSLTEIEVYAFYNCSNLTGSLTIPNNVNKISNRAFYNCKGFNGSLTLPDKLEIIDYLAFYNCSNLTGTVHIPIKVNLIRDHAFNGCIRIDKFRFPHTTPLPYTFGFLPEGVTVEVPESAVITYKQMFGWNEYNIVGF